MAVDNALKFANRCGLNLTVKNFDTSKIGTIEIDFANECALELAGDTTWATGGQFGSKLVGFPNPIEGTFRISTQIMTKEILNLLVGGEVGATATDFVFKNDTTTSINYYTIEGDTVWQNAKGVTEAEHIVIHKALPKRAYNVVYNGSGDPISVDVEFELLADGDEAKIVTITKG